MSQLNLTAPLTFEPIFMERMWGGRGLNTEFGKKLPANVRIGESWEIVDRPEAQSLVRDGPMRGRTLHQLWYVLDAVPDAQIYAGLRRGVTREQFEAALENSSVAELVHRISVKDGDAISMPSGRLHTMGHGILVAEIQQNSDTTYRVFDWNRLGTDGEPRRLHVSEAMQSIDFTDIEPNLIQSRGETLVRDSVFVVEKWDLIS